MLVFQVPTAQPWGVGAPIRPWGFSMCFSLSPEEALV